MLTHTTSNNDRHRTASHFAIATLRLRTECVFAAKSKHPHHGAAQLAVEWFGQGHPSHAGRLRQRGQLYSDLPLQTRNFVGMLALAFSAACGMYNTGRLKLDVKGCDEPQSQRLLLPALHSSNLNSVALRQRAKVFANTEVL